MKKKEIQIGDMISFSYKPWNNTVYWGIVLQIDVVTIGSEEDIQYRLHLLNPTQDDHKQAWIHHNNVEVPDAKE